MSTREAIEAITRVMKPIQDAMREIEPFKNRGFSERTIRALVNCGIEAPERLLFMTETQLQKVPGIGVVSMREIRAYRTQFIL